jgi:hypothetical protein
LIRNVKWAAVLPLAVLVASCGGGSGGGSGGGAGGSTPAPGPAPAPSPAARYSVVGIGAVLARVDIDTNGNGVFADAADTVTSTSATGEFGRDVPVMAHAGNTGTVPSSPTARMQASGVDAWTGFWLPAMSAPVGATVISPLTTLIAAQGSEARVRAALGLDTGPDALRAQTALLTFDPVANLAHSDPAIAADAARLTSLNIQLFALASILKDTTGDRVDRPAPFDRSSQYLAEVISTRDAPLTDSAVIRELLMKSRYRFGDPAQISAMAELVAQYMKAIPARVSYESEAREWALGFRFYVFPEFQLLASQWPPAPPTRVIRAGDIYTVLSIFRGAGRPTVGAFMAAPDYVELSPFSAVPYQTVLVGCDNATALPSCNDSELFLGWGVSSVVDSATALAPDFVTATLVGGALTINRGRSFTGMSAIAYTSRSRQGGTTTGTLYVRVR